MSLNERNDSILPIISDLFEHTDGVAYVIVRIDDDKKEIETAVGRFPYKELECSGAGFFLPWTWKIRLS